MNTQKELTLAEVEDTGEEDASALEVVEITRYPNRRLYDRSRARYVTLQEVADTVRQGKTVTVRDSKSGEDLTRSFLIQIILEQCPERMEMVPVAVLNSMIRANAVVLGFLRDYFRQAMGYLEVMQRLAAINPFVPPLDWMKSFLPRMTPSPPAISESAAPPATDPDAEALVRRVAELEQRLNQLDASAKTSGPKKPASSKGPKQE